ncbi:MAG: hypothetical protein FWD58_07030 [Firmicutes bacterium]|nr:hypothetical protein [Bacillota bacterium]
MRESNIYGVGNGSHYGHVKLYPSAGQNDDGAMTQKAVTDAISESGGYAGESPVLWIGSARTVEIDMRVLQAFRARETVNLIVNCYWGDQYRNSGCMAVVIPLIIAQGTVIPNPDSTTVYQNPQANAFPYVLEIPFKFNPRRGDAYFYWGYTPEQWRQYNYLANLTFRLDISVDTEIGNSGVYSFDGTVGTVKFELINEQIESNNQGQDEYPNEMRTYIQSVRAVVGEKEGDDRDFNTNLEW